MSEEFLFDSERMEQREQRKRRLLPLLVLAGIVVLAVVIALIMRGSRGKVHSAGENTAYPFTWTARPDGTVELLVPHEDAPESRWTLKDGKQSLPILWVGREEKEARKGTAFTMRPELAGRTLVTLVLADEGDEPRAFYELTLLMEVSEEEGKLSAALLDATGSGVKAGDAKIELSGAQDSENPYRIYTSKDGRLVLSVQISKFETDWIGTILQGDACLELQGVIYEDDHADAYLKPGASPGPSTLELRSEIAGVKLLLKLETGSDGSLRVTEHHAEIGEKQQLAEPDPEQYEETHSPDDEQLPADPAKEIVVIFSDDPRATEEGADLNPEISDHSMLPEESAAPETEAAEKP